MHTDTAIVLTALVLCYAAMSGLVKRWYVAPGLIFVAFGILLGPFGFHVIDPGDDEHAFTVLAQLALTVVLFNQAAALDVPAALRRGRLTFRLLVLGIPLTIGFNTVAAVILLPTMPLWEALCLAAIVAPTEVALIDALLEDTRIPDRVRNALSVESGFYDGFALAALFAALALASEHTDHDPARWSWFAVRTEALSLGVGLVVGGLGGVIISRSLRRRWMSDTWAQLATLAVALLCFQLGEVLHASGFVAAFVGGFAYATIARHVGTRAPTQFTDAAAQLLELVVFALFGGYAVIAGWRDAGWRVIAFAVVALFVVRLLAVSLALLRSDLPARSRLFIGWFGPRGIGTVVLGLLVIGRGELQQADLVTQVVVVTVTLSLLLHSITVPVGIRLVQADRLTGSADRPAGPSRY